MCLEMVFGVRGVTWDYERLQFTNSALLMSAFRQSSPTRRRIRILSLTHA